MVMILQNHLLQQTARNDIPSTVSHLIFVVLSTLANRKIFVSEPYGDIKSSLIKLNASSSLMELGSTPKDGGKKTDNATETLPVENQDMAPSTVVQRSKISLSMKQSNIVKQEESGFEKPEDNPSASAPANKLSGRPAEEATGDIGVEQPSELVEPQIQESKKISLSLGKKQIGKTSVVNPPISGRQTPKLKLKLRPGLPDSSRA